MKKLLTICLISTLMISGCSRELINLIPKNMKSETDGKHWSEPYIETLIGSGVMSGYPDGNYYPDKEITREESATLIYNLSGKASPVSNHFSDISHENNWSFEAINSMYEQEYINGYSDSTFRPTEPMTREEFASLVYNFMNANGYIDSSETKFFKDTQGRWSAEQIGILASNNIVSGYDDGNFNPDSSITRGEAAKIISSVEYLTNLKKPNEHQDINEALIKGFNDFRTIFSFSYPHRTTPEEVAEIYKESLRGTYYEGIIDTISIVVKSNSSESTVEIKTQYLHNKNEESILTDFIRNKADEINSSYTSDYDKIKAAHDWIIKSTKYDEGDENTQNTVGVNIHSPYSIISDGHGVCQSYALMNYRLLSELGYNTLYVTGDASNSTFTGPHAWNLVQIGDQWYHIDATWDDPVPDIFNTVRYEYFLVSDDRMAESHSWERSNYPNAPNSYQ